EFQLQSPSVRGAGFAGAERRYALGRSHLVAGSVATMRLRSHTQEPLSQAFPRNSSDNLGFLVPKEREASLAWSPPLFSKIQIGLLFPSSASRTHSDRFGFHEAMPNVQIGNSLDFCQSFPSDVIFRNSCMSRSLNVIF